MTMTPETARDTTVRRRTLVKGTAWAAPAIAIGNAAPAMAASRPPGLQGWVTVGKQCRSASSGVLTINGTGGGNANPPNTNSRGLWIYNTNSGTTITNASMTFYYPTSLGTISWSSASGNSGWSVPAVDTRVPQIPGYRAYTTNYSGSWQFYDNPGLEDDHHRATGRPNFTASLTISNCGQPLPVYARRTVTVDGEVVTFQRGPVTIG